MDNKIIYLKGKGAELKDEVRKKTLEYILAGFGLVAGLAWNEAIKAFIEAFFPLQKDTLKAKFIYAAIITIVLVLVSLYLSKLLKKNQPENPGGGEDASAQK